MESISNTKEREADYTKLLVENLKKLPSFIENIQDKSIFYPGCDLDIAPMVVFPENNITFLDKEISGLNAIRKYIAVNKDIPSYNKSVVQNTMDSNFNQKFDILIDQRSQVPEDILSKAINPGGYVIVENAHGHGNYFNSNPGYEFVQSLSTGSKKYKPVKRAIEGFSTGDGNYYLFKKLTEGELQKHGLPKLVQRIKNYFIQLFS